jgi:hypothetical protein
VEEEPLRLFSLATRRPLGRCSRTTWPLLIAVCLFQKGWRQQREDHSVASLRAKFITTNLQPASPPTEWNNSHMPITPVHPVGRLSQRKLAELSCVVMACVFDIHQEFGRLFEERVVNGGL